MVRNKALCLCLSLSPLPRTARREQKKERGHLHLRLLSERLVWFRDNLPSETRRFTVQETHRLIEQYVARRGRAAGWFALRCSVGQPGARLGMAYEGCKSLHHLVSVLNVSQLFLLPKFDRRYHRNIDFATEIENFSTGATNSPSGRKAYAIPIGRQLPKSFYNQCAYFTTIHCYRISCNCISKQKLRVKY